MPALPPTAPPDATAADPLAEEARWAAAARAGDAAAFERLVRRHQSAVRWQLRRLAHGDAALADDLAQQAFVQAWRHRAAFDGRARWSTWVHRIAVREYLQHLRRPGSAPWATLEPEAGAGDTQADSGATPVPEAARVADLAPAGALRVDVERALSALSEAQRLCVVHCFQLELTHEEAAEVLGLPVGTVKSHLNRARARLQAALAPWTEDLP